MTEDQVIEEEAHDDDMTELKKGIALLDKRLDELEKSVGTLRQNMATTINALSSYEDHINSRLIKLGSASAHLIAAVGLLTEARE